MEAEADRLLRMSWNVHEHDSEIEDELRMLFDSDFHWWEDTSPPYGSTMFLLRSSSSLTSRIFRHGWLDNHKVCRQIDKYPLALASSRECISMILSLLEEKTKPFWVKERMSVLLSKIASLPDGISNLTSEDSERLARVCGTVDTGKASHAKWIARIEKVVQRIEHPLGKETKRLKREWTEMW